MKRSNLLVFVFTLATIIGVQSCKDDDPIQVTALFSSDKTEILVGETITFTDDSEGGATSWKWTFDNGTPSEMITSTAQNPQITFNNFGKYTITLEVSNGGTVDIINGTTEILVDEIQTIFSNFATTGAAYDNNGPIISDYQQGSSFVSGALATGTHKLESLEFGFRKWTSNETSTYKILFCADSSGLPAMSSAQVFATFSNGSTESANVSLSPNADIQIDPNTTYWFVFDIDGTHTNTSNGLWLSANGSTTGSKRAYRRIRQGQTNWSSTPSAVSSMKIKTRRSAN